MYTYTQSYVCQNNEMILTNKPHSEEQNIIFFVYFMIFMERCWQIQIKIEIPRQK